MVRSDWNWVVPELLVVWLPLDSDQHIYWKQERCLAFFHALVWHRQFTYQNYLLAYGLYTFTVASILPPYFDWRRFPSQIGWVQVGKQKTEDRQPSSRCRCKSGIPIPSMFGVFISPTWPTWMVRKISVGQQTSPMDAKRYAIKVFTHAKTSKSTYAFGVSDFWLCSYIYIVLVCICLNTGGVGWGSILNVPKMINIFRLVRWNFQMQIQYPPQT